jgi:hypothetical protein
MIGQPGPGPKDSQRKSLTRWKLSDEQNAGLPARPKRRHLDRGTVSNEGRVRAEHECSMRNARSDPFDYDRQKN